MCLLIAINPCLILQIWLCWLVLTRPSSDPANTGRIFGGPIEGADTAAIELVLNKLVDPTRRGNMLIRLVHPKLHLITRRGALDFGDEKFRCTLSNDWLPTNFSSLY